MIKIKIKGFRVTLKQVNGEKRWIRGYRVNCGMHQLKPTIPNRKCFPVQRTKTFFVHRSGKCIQNKICYSKRNVYQIDHSTQRNNTELIDNVNDKICQNEFTHDFWFLRWWTWLFHSKTCWILHEWLEYHLLGVRSRKYMLDDWIQK